MIRRSKSRRNSLLGTFEPLECRALLASHSGSDWHNLDFPVDVNADGVLSGRDALLVINNLNQNGAHALSDRAEGEPGSANSATTYVDVNADNFLSARDALQVINELTSEGEHEPGHAEGDASGHDHGDPDHEVTDHIHVQMDIYINGELVNIPQDIGIDDTGIISIVHTHAADNRLHSHPVAAATPTDFTTLGDFFDAWRTNGGNAGNNPDAVFSETEILGNAVDEDHSLRMFVNGKENFEFENYRWHDEDRIVILYEDVSEAGSPIVLPVGSQIDLLSGSPLNLPLQGFDSENQNLTYSVSVDSNLVDARILEGNRSLRFSVIDYGELTFELFEQRVPIVTDKIIEFVEDGLYEEAEFYGIADLDPTEGEGLLTQGGHDGARLFFQPVEEFDDQFHFELQHNAPGLLSLATTLDDGNRAEFFVTAEPFRALDFDKPVYGVLTQGENIRQRIMNSPTQEDSIFLVDRIVIESAEIIEDNANAVMVLQAAEGASGTANVTVTVTDEDGNSFDRTYAVDVTPDEVNGLPFLDPVEDVIVRQGDPIQIQLSANDVEGDPFFFDAAAVEGDTEFEVEVDANSGLITVIPPADFMGILEVDAVVRNDMEPIDLTPENRDRDRTQDRERFAIEIIGQFHAVDDAFEVDEDSGENSLDPLANDTIESAGELRIIEVSTPQNGTVAISSDGTQIIYEPDANYFGEDTFTYTIEDGIEGTSIGTIVVDVQPVNDLPTANDDTVSVVQGAIDEAINVLINDTVAPDRGETLFIIDAGNTSQGGTVAISDDAKSLVYSPASDFIGTETLTYTVSDETEGSTSTATVTVEVLAFSLSTVSGSIYVDSNHNGVRDESEFTMGGVTVTLTGTNLDGSSVNLSTRTMLDGSYVISEIPPGEYTVETSRPFTQSGTVTVGPQGGTVSQSGNEIKLMLDGDGTELDQNNFGANGISPEYAFWYSLATAPIHQALIAVSPEMGMEWFILDSSWANAQLQSVEYSADRTELIFDAINENGDPVTATVPVAGDARIRVIGREDAMHLVQLNATFNQMRFEIVPEA